MTPCIDRYGNHHPSISEAARYLGVTVGKAHAHFKMHGSLEGIVSYEGRRLPNRLRKPLPPLVAPAEYMGKISKTRPEELRIARKEWAAEMGRRGYSSVDVASALGIRQHPAWKLMVAGGWDAWADKRQRAKQEQGR